MNVFQHEVEFRIERYRDAVRDGERHGLCLAQVEPQTAIGRTLVRRAAEWLTRQRPSLSRDVWPGVVRTRGKPAS
jgi:hypothetical protein